MLNLFILLSFNTGLTLSHVRVPLHPVPVQHSSEGSLIPLNNRPLSRLFGLPRRCLAVFAVRSGPLYPLPKGVRLEHG